jgi:hypothetical protein
MQMWLIICTCTAIARQRVGKQVARTQILRKHSVAGLHITDEAVLSIVSAEQRWNNGIMQSVSKQLLGKR